MNCRSLLLKPCFAGIRTAARTNRIKPSKSVDISKDNDTPDKNDEDDGYWEMGSRTLDNLSSQTNRLRNAEYYRRMLGQFDKEIKEAAQNERIGKNRDELGRHWQELKERSRQKRIQQKLKRQNDPNHPILDRSQIETIRYLMSKDGGEIFTPGSLSLHYKIDADEVLRISKANSNEIAVLKLRYQLKYSPWLFASREKDFTETSALIKRAEAHVKSNLERLEKERSSAVNRDINHRFIK